LDDEALEIIASALENVVSQNKEEAVIIKVEEMCFRGNNLTAKSLQSIAAVVNRSSADLKDLDISNNKISIDTDKDAEAWEMFLSSFRDCFMLRRLDMSGNALGHKGFEILTKVYTREQTHPIGDLGFRDMSQIFTDNGMEEDMKRLSLDTRAEHSPFRQPLPVETGDEFHPRRGLLRLAPED
jgi:hypothetical protein